MKTPTALLSSWLLLSGLSLTAQQPAAPVPADPVPASTTLPAAGTGQLPAVASSQVELPSPAPSADVDANYILGADDSIRIDVWKEPSLSGPLVIRPDGRISLPLIGDLPATGMTPMALAASVSDRLKKFINDPTVTVTVTAATSRRIFLLGEVGRPGPLAMTRDMTMLQAISAAGGVTPYANKKKMYVLRGEKGKQTKLPFNYEKALKTGDMQGLVLLPGDTIVAP